MDTYSNQIVYPSADNTNVYNSNANPFYMDNTFNMNMGMLPGSFKGIDINSYQTKGMLNQLSSFPINDTSSQQMKINVNYNNLTDFQFMQPTESEKPLYNTSDTSDLSPNTSGNSATFLPIEAISQSQTNVNDATALTLQPGENVAQNNFNDINNITLQSNVSSVALSNTNTPSLLNNYFPTVSNQYTFNNNIDSSSKLSYNLPYTYTPYSLSNYLNTTDIRNYPYGLPSQYSSSSMMRMANMNLVPQKKYSFITMNVNKTKKRTRRKYEEIDRKYKCDYCEKGYGTLNNLNAHISINNHGKKKTSSDFKHLTKKEKVLI